NAVPPNPTFKVEQEIWVKKVAPRPWPKAAKELVPQLKPIFASERVPEELVWLAEVESGFDASAESPAGALGMFQLMPATAKQYGLSLWPFDERKQTEPAARAAAKQLRRLYTQFGDWRLAVAAYNCGEGRVQKALSRYKTKSYERIATHLPAETQMYVPKVEATISLREGASLQKLKLPGAL
ncbi:MAG: lytic transglycosylase domain-containing protein, partial [Verrucomicrobia bacterium]|nr:lytic transglycosylase domain-containing protein [Verrucomicrobiota bacterium]